MAYEPDDESNLVECAECGASWVTPPVLEVLHGAIGTAILRFKLNLVAD